MAGHPPTSTSNPPSREEHLLITSAPPNPSSWGTPQGSRLQGESSLTGNGPFSFLISEWGNTFANSKCSYREDECCPGNGLGTCFSDSGPCLAGRQSWPAEDLRWFPGKQHANTKLSQVGAVGEARAPADFPTEEMVTSLLR